MAENVLVLICSVADCYSSCAYSVAVCPLHWRCSILLAAELCTVGSVVGVRCVGMHRLDFQKLEALSFDSWACAYDSCALANVSCLHFRHWLLKTT